MTQKFSKVLFDLQYLYNYCHENTIQTLAAA